ncbi:MAG: GNAT family N-acetyltransferase, partial [Betaproteobacteria bacterium]
MSEAGRLRTTTTRKRATAIAPAPAAADLIAIRRVRSSDLEQIIALDAKVNGVPKRSYWRSLFRRYGLAGQAGKQFLVADAGGRMAGFVIGEIRDWEFGSEPCGWVFAIDVQPEFRLAGVGARLLAALSANLRRAGARKLRTMLARDNTLVLSFFR